jgi:hypothetical protein
VRENDPGVGIFGVVLGVEDRVSAYSAGEADAETGGWRDGNNNVTGKYVSAVSGTGGPTPSTDLRGTVTGELIAFTVNCGSAFTTWAGDGVFDSANQPQILTLWQLVIWWFQLLTKRIHRTSGRQ